MTSVTELRMMECPYNRDQDQVTRRQHMIARLPGVKILNGGDEISEFEREQAERAFIRHFLESETKPDRSVDKIQRGGTICLVRGLCHNNLF